MDTVTDYISKREVPAGAEEVFATQPFSRKLVEDYNYPKEHIQTRPQYMIKRSPSARSGSLPVDIAIFEDARKRSEGLHIVVECKPDPPPQILDNIASN